MVENDKKDDKKQNNTEQRKAIVAVSSFGFGFFSFLFTALSNGRWENGLVTAIPSALIGFIISYLVTRKPRPKNKKTTKTDNYTNLSDHPPVHAAYENPVSTPSPEPDNCIEIRYSYKIAAILNIMLGLFLLIIYKIFYILFIPVILITIGIIAACQCFGNKMKAREWFLILQTIIAFGTVFFAIVIPILLLIIGLSFILPFFR